MLIKFLHWIFALLGFVIGIATVWLFFHLPLNMITDVFNLYERIALYIAISVTFGFSFYFIYYKLLKLFSKLFLLLDKKITELPINDMISGALGLVLGLLIAYLISYPVRMIRVPWLSIVFTLIVYVFMAFLGVYVSNKKKDELIHYFTHRRSQKNGAIGSSSISTPKVLDTSSIVDGRIYDVCKSGFVEGPLIIPNFVLTELRKIADSSDQLKRNRGRHGLDVLNKIQNELEIEVKIFEDNLDELLDVDAKLLKTAAILKAKILTTDYNLNKVAEFQGVTVLNINELANSLKPVLVPGEEIIVQVVKDGKEAGQGLAFLDDGTMIVIEGGKKYVGESVGINVTSVFQTAAGRMIFAKTKHVAG